MKKPAGTAAATKVHTVTAAAFLSATAAVTGNAEGEICLWKKMKSGFWHLKERVKAHKTGSKERCVDGSMGYSGVRVLRLRAGGNTLLSGGADGMVMLWSVTSGTRFCLSPMKQMRPAARAPVLVWPGLVC